MKPKFPKPFDFMNNTLKSPYKTFKQLTGQWSTVAVQLPQQDTESDPDRTQDNNRIYHILSFTILAVEGISTWTFVLFAYLFIFVGVAKRVHQFPELRQAQNPVLVAVCERQQALRKLLDGNVRGLQQYGS